MSAVEMEVVKELVDASIEDGTVVDSNVDQAFVDQALIMRDQEIDDKYIEMLCKRIGAYTDALQTEMPVTTSIGGEQLYSSIWTEQEMKALKVPLRHMLAALATYGEDTQG